MSTPPRDAEVRQATHNRLLAHARRCPNTLVINELGLQHGAVRIDIAIINGHIKGIEIKADADNLSRLSRQIAAYGTVVDKATLITGKRHVESAMRQLPNWWCVIVASRSCSGPIIFKKLREGRINHDVDPMMIVQLMWRNEIVDVLRDLGHDRKLSRAPRSDLYTALVAALPHTQLTKIVRETLKTRENWRDRIRLSQYGDSSPPNATS